MLLGFGKGHADECIAGGAPWLPLSSLDRLVRSLFALGRVLTWVVSAALTAYAIELAFRSGAPTASSAADVVSGVLFVGVFGVYVAALGTALISAKEPSWRLLALSDHVAGIVLLVGGIALELIGNAIEHRATRGK